MKYKKIKARLSKYLSHSVIALAIFGWMGFEESLKGVVLDDFSSDQFGSYTLKLNTPDSAWNISNGELRPIFPNGPSDAIFCWNGGEALSAIGDSISIDLEVFPGLDIAQGGLTLWNNSSSGGTFADLVAHIRLTALVGGEYELWSDVLPSEFAPLPLSGAPLGIATLSVTISNKTVAGTELTVSLTGTGFNPVAHIATTSYTGDIYFGPMAFLADGTNVQLDNFAFTSAVPEPSVLALVFGGLVVMVIRSTAIFFTIAIENRRPCRRI